MKSFFKKLSFVLAAAMIITLIPAQAAKAEGVIKLALQSAASVSDAISYDTLKVGEKQDYKFYGCLDYKTTGLGWVSSNEAVATVDKSGVVTAVAAGVAQISYEAKGYTTEAITLLVADEYDVNLAKQENKEVVTAFKFTAIGQEQDFCFVGAKGYSLNTHKCTWFSTNTAVATVDKVGNVTAVGEGNAQIVLTIVEKATNKVAFAVAPVAITVEVAKLAATQTSYNTAKVTFNDEAAKDIKVYSVVDDQRQVEYVEQKDGVVTFYNELVNGREYVFVANGSEASFVASIAPVASFELSTKSQMPDQINGKIKWIDDAAFAGQPTQVQISNFVDANGIAVKRKNYTFEFEDVCDDIKSINYDGVIYIAEKGEVHNVTVTAIDVKTNEKVLSKSITVVGTTVPSITIQKNTVVAKVGTVAKVFDKCGTDFRLSIDDEDTYALALSLKDSRENLYKFNAGQVMTGTQNDAGLELLRDIGQFVFESTDYDVLGVTDSGVLEARSEGHATILVYFEYVDDDLTQTQKVLLTSVPFTVIGHLVPTTVTLKYVNTNMFKNGSYVRLADQPGACNFNTAEIAYTVKDQLGRDLVCDVEVTISNSERLDTAPVVNGIKVTALDIAPDTKDQITSNIKFKFTKWGVSRTASATVNVVNLDDAKQSQIPGVAMCLVDKAAGIGNTDNTNADHDDIITVGVHIVDVYYVGTGYVYGDNVEQSANGLLLNYSTIKNLSTSRQLEAQEDPDHGTPGAFYVEIKLNNKLIDLNSPLITLVDNNAEHPAAGASNYGKYIQIQIRDAFDNLSEGNAFDDAVALSKIKSVKLEANVYDLYNTNTMESSQATTTWKKGICSKYDSVGTIEYLNNDEVHYAANLVINDLTYQGDIPRTGDDWADWFDGHTDLSANVWRVGDTMDSCIKGKAYDYDTADDTERFDSTIDPRVLYGFAVETMTANSKYIQAAGLFFNLYGSATANAFGNNEIVTYIPYKIGKKVTQENYQYKTEDQVPDGEFPGIWAD
jgi:hypothetical protein